VYTTSVHANCVLLHTAHNMVIYLLNWPWLIYLARKWPSDKIPFFCSFVDLWENRLSCQTYFSEKVGMGFPITPKLDHNMTLSLILLFFDLLALAQIILLQVIYLKTWFSCAPANYRPTKSCFFALLLICGKTVWVVKVTSVKSYWKKCVWAFQLHQNYTTTCLASSVGLRTDSSACSIMPIAVQLHSRADSLTQASILLR